MRNPLGRITRWLEMFINWLTRNRPYRGTVVLGAPGGRVTFRIGARIGAGFFGVIHATEIVAFDPEAPAQRPLLFDAGRPRVDIVLKFPQNVPFPIPRYFFNRALLDELYQTELIDRHFRAMGFEPIAGAEILASVLRPPFLVKRLLVGRRNIAAIARTQSELDDRQRDALRRLYERAERLLKDHNLALDIKPENLLWNDETGIWEMYEVSDLPIARMFYADGFDNYLDIVDSVIAMERE